jgi:hypothetical protein
MMEKIDTGHRWSRVAGTQRVRKIKRRQQKTPFNRHAQQPDDDTQETRSEDVEAAEEDSPEAAKRQACKPLRPADCRRQDSAPEDDHPRAKVATGKRIDIRV